MFQQEILDTVAQTLENGKHGEKDQHQGQQRHHRKEAGVGQRLGALQALMQHEIAVDKQQELRELC